MVGRRIKKLPLDKKGESDGVGVGRKISAGGRSEIAQMCYKLIKDRDRRRAVFLK